MSEKNGRPTLDEAFAGLLKDTVSEFRTDLRLVSQQVHEHGGKLERLDQRLSTMEVECVGRHQRISEAMRGLRDGLENTGEHIIIEGAKTSTRREMLKAAALYLSMLGTAVGLGLGLHQCTGKTRAATTRPADAAMTAGRK